MYSSKADQSVDRKECWGCGKLEIDQYEKKLLFDTAGQNTRCLRSK